MYFKSIDDMNRDIIQGLHKFPKDIDIVIGVPRSGLLVANIIALHLNAPLADIDSFLEGNVFKSGTTRRDDRYEERINNPRKILVVEDSVNSGASIIEVKKKIENKLSKDIEIVYFAAYVAPEKEDLVDIYLDVCQLPRVFEWNIMHHSVIENSCFDLDGVLCIDPEDGQDDDGQVYREFLCSVPTLFVPTRTIDTIVTCRLEKYREDTERWLAKNKIKYNRLIMMSYATKEERIRAGKHGEYKAKHYKKTGAKLFIESSLSQAITIAKISGKPVYCIEVRKMIYPNANYNDSGYVTKRMRINNYIGRIKCGVKCRIKRLIS